MPLPLPLIVAIVAALAIILIAYGISSGGPVDPVQARLTQLGASQARTLEEMELQLPFFDRTVKPLAARISAKVSRSTSTSLTERTEKRLALAGNPGDMRTADWLGIKAISSIVVAGIMFVVLGLIGQNIFGGIAFGAVGLGFGYIFPEFWLGGKVKARRKAILLQIPDALDLLTISVRAGLGFDAALGKEIGRAHV